MAAPPDIPGIPPELLEVAARGKLVIFVGAGVSLLAGGPSWNSFADELLNRLATKKFLSFGDLHQLRHIDPRKKVSIAMDICREQNFVPPLRETLQKDVSAQNVSQLYRDLYSIGTPFVTTNYDEWLDVLAETPFPSPGPIALAASGTQLPPPGAPSPKVIFHAEQMTVDKLAIPGAVIHLHGSVRDPDTMVLTARHYLEHYRSPTVQTFLDTLFRTYTVLFVGYGLEEDDILEHVLRKKNAPTKEKEHFRLYPRYSYQEHLSAYLASYSLNHYGVQHLDFCIDGKNHEQLTSVIADWSRQLKSKVQDQLYLEKIKIIDDALDQR